MEGQTRPTSLYFSEKLIRLGSSAAICGLTISFIFGEMVDAKSGFFRDWIPISSLMPTEYPVTAPMLTLAEHLQNGDWSYSAEQVAINQVNSLEEIQLAEAQLPKINSDNREKIEAVIESVHEATAQVLEDKITAVAAAPIEPQKIFGKIHLDGSFASGHFEVVIHDAVDSSGAPSGFPVGQQILKQDEDTYSFDLSSNKERFLFLKFFPGADDTTPAKIFPFAKNPIRINSAPPYDFHVALVADTKSGAQEERNVTISGRVGAMFSTTGFIPLPDAVVKIRGTTLAATTSTSGDFNLVVPEFSGEAVLEVVKKDFYPTILSVQKDRASEKLSIELASREAVDKMAALLNISQVRSKGIIIGQVSAGAGVSVSLTNSAKGPYYFGTHGHPIDGEKATLENGRFIYFNVEAGVGYLDLKVKGDPVAPVIVSPVEGGGIIYKNLKIVDGKVRGRVFNPVNGKAMQPVVGARIRIEGSSEWSISDSIGAFQLPQFRYAQGESIAIELMADKFYTHRFLAAPSFIKAKTVEMNLFIFPSAYINDLANSLDLSLDPYAGLIVGNVGPGKSLRIDALADHSSVNGAKDFYFDEKGILRGGRVGTHPGYGTYVIFNVPRGRTLLQGVDRAGKVRHFSSAYASPSVVTIAVDR